MRLKGSFFEGLLYGVPIGVFLWIVITIIIREIVRLF
jgi:tetrahydromethanopterin S-methyltransferase subunit G